MKLVERIYNFGKVGEIVNALIHKINISDLTTLFTSHVTVESQLAYSEPLKRYVFNAGTSVKVLASRDDIRTLNPTIYYSVTDPILDINNTVKQGDLWVNGSNVISVYSGSQWDLISSSIVFKINDFSTLKDYLVGDMVMYNNILYQNLSGSTISAGAFNASLWTQITNILTQVQSTLSNTILDGTTVGNVSRVGNNYTIAHGMNTNNVLVEGYDASGVVYLYDYQRIDNNNIRIRFDQYIDTDVFVVNIYKLK